MKILVLGLGNDILADDAFGILAVRAVEADLGDRVHAVGCSLSGIALLDVLLDFDRAIIIDAIHTRARPVGSILELAPLDLGPVLAPSPHFAGLPEMISLAKHLELDFPAEVKILAVEVADKSTIGGPMTEAVRAAISPVVARVREIVAEWEKAEG